MHDINGSAAQQPTQGHDVAQRRQRLAANVSLQVLAALVEQLGHQAPTRGHHQRAVTCRDQRAADVEGAALNATRLECGEDLQDR